MNEVCGTGSYEVKDIATATKYVRKKSRRKGTYAAFVIMPVLVIVASILTNPAKAASELASSLLLPIIVAVILLSVIAYYGYFRKRHYGPFDLYLAGRAVKKSRFLNGEFEICFTTEGLRSEHALSSSLVRWQVYERAVETKEHIYLYSFEKSATFIPKRFFRNDDLTWIRELLGSHFQDEFAIDL